MQVYEQAIIRLPSKQPSTIEVVLVKLQTNQHRCILTLSNLHAIVEERIGEKNDNDAGAVTEKSSAISGTKGPTG